MKIVTSSAEWRETLRKIPTYDFYHTYDYHSLAAGYESGRPILLVEGEGDEQIALPLILRSGSIHGRDFKDATSVYGYSGPISGKAGESREDREFGIAVTDTLKQLGVISVFSRLHPLLRNERLVEGMGVVEHCGRTVSIDLTHSEDEHWNQYSTNHKRGVRKCRKLGVECSLSDAAGDLKEFEKIYTQSMLRVNASEQYFFGADLFDALLNSSDFAMHLFVCRLDEKVICGGLFSSCNGIVQYHLGGTRSESLNIAPSKLMFDAVRRWAKRTGHTVFHLGGGLGGRDDSLYQFKKGFSEIEAPFYLWKWILDDEAYQSLACLNKKDTAAQMPRMLSEGFFPAYRAPVGR